MTKIAAIRKADEEARERDQASETEDDAILAVEVEKIADAAEPLKQLKPPKLQKPLWSQELHPAI